MGVACTDAAASSADDCNGVNHPIRHAMQTSCRSTSGTVVPHSKLVCMHAGEPTPGRPAADLPGREERDIRYALRRVVMDKLIIGPVCQVVQVLHADNSCNRLS